jgi:hypothetical protein
MDGIHGGFEFFQASLERIHGGLERHGGDADRHGRLLLSSEAPAPRPESARGNRVRCAEGLLV